MKGRCMSKSKKDTVRDPNRNARGSVQVVQLLPPPIVYVPDPADFRIVVQQLTGSASYSPAVRPADSKCGAPDHHLHGFEDGATPPVIHESGLMPAAAAVIVVEQSPPQSPLPDYVSSGAELELQSSSSSYAEEGGGIGAASGRQGTAISSSSMSNCSPASSPLSWCFEHPFLHYDYRNEDSVDECNCSAISCWNDEPLLSSAESVSERLIDLAGLEGTHNDLLIHQDEQFQMFFDDVVTVDL